MRCAFTCILPIKASRLTDGHGVLLMTPNREVWTFSAGEGRVQLEDSVYLSANEGPRRTVADRDLRRGAFGAARHLEISAVHARRGTCQHGHPAARAREGPEIAALIRGGLRYQAFAHSLNRNDGMQKGRVKAAHDRTPTPHHPRPRFRFRQDRPDRVRAGARRLRHRNHFDRRHAPGTDRGRAPRAPKCRRSPAFPR